MFEGSGILALVIVVFAIATLWSNEKIVPQG